MEDLSKSVGMIHSSLKYKLTDACKAGYKSFFSHDKLIIVNDKGKRNAYTYDTLNKTIKPVYRNLNETDR